MIFLPKTNYTYGKTEKGQKKVDIYPYLPSYMSFSSEYLDFSFTEILF